MKKIVFSILGVVMGCIAAMAQIGYQVAIIDQSTGKPKANQTVSVVVSLENNAGKTIYSDTQSATANEFGVVSLQIGNTETFSNMDWSKLPLWVSASVDGVTIGKTQVLNVPVAEHAKHWGTLTKEILTSKSWSGTDHGIACTYNFSSNGTGTYGSHYPATGDPCDHFSFRYYIVGNSVVLVNDVGSYVLIYVPEINALAETRWGRICK